MNDLDLVCLKFKQDPSTRFFDLGGRSAVVMIYETLKILTGLAATGSDFHGMPPLTVADQILSDGE